MDNKAIKLINMILRQESGYANVSGDLGGETYRGITRKNFPKWDGWKIVDENKPLKNRQIIDNEELENNVMDFYYDNFYTPDKSLTMKSWRIMLWISIMIISIPQ